MEEKGEPYKVELIQDLPEDAEISFYSQGGICRSVRRSASDEHKGYQGLQADVFLRGLLERRSRKTRCCPVSMVPPLPKRMS